MPIYDGPAEVISSDGTGLTRVTAHLRSHPPTADRFGTWQGEVVPANGEGFDGPIDLGEVVLRLPSGRKARAVLKSKHLSERPSLELVGSGPPPF